MNEKLYSLFIDKDSTLNAIAIIENGNEYDIPIVEEELIKDGWVIVEYNFMYNGKIIFNLNHKDLYKVYANDK